MRNRSDNLTELAIHSGGQQPVGSLQNSVDKALGRISPAGTFSGYRGGQPFERPASIGDAGLCYKFKSMSEKVRWSARQVRGALCISNAKRFPRVRPCASVLWRARSFRAPPNQQTIVSCRFSFVSKEYTSQAAMTDCSQQ